MDLSLELQLFQGMLRIRRIEEAIAEKYQEQKMRCPVHLSIGQEAVAVGVCSACSPSDYIVSAHRAHAHYLAKGGDICSMIAEMYGKETGCCAGIGGSMHLVDWKKGILGTTPIVGGSIPIGVGAAFHTYLHKKEQVTIVFFGEGATEEGVWSESLNFAALKKLPVLFVCENNFYAVYSHLKVRQPKERDRIKIVHGHGVPGDVFDGNDVKQVYQQAKLAIDFIRKGNGPYYLEFTTYRYREHCGPKIDVNLGERSQKEFNSWLKKCPITTYQTKLLQEKKISLERLTFTEKEIQEEIQNAFTFAQNSPFPSYPSQKEEPLTALCLES